jgi:hypothetical protein
MIDMFYKMILYSQTTIIRLFFGLSSLCGALFLGKLNSDDTYAIIFDIAPRKVWVGLLLLNGFALIYGVVTKKYSNFLLIAEGVLGVAIWSSIAVISIIINVHQIVPLIVALCALWVLIRYPTHREFHD